MKLDVTLDEANSILGALAKQPFELVYQLISNLSAQIQGSVNAERSGTAPDRVATPEVEPFPQKSEA